MKYLGFGIFVFWLATFGSIFAQQHLDFETQFIMYGFLGTLFGAGFLLGADKNG